MNKLLLVFFLKFLSTCGGAEENAHEKKMSEYILTILEHYKQEDPVGLPGAPIPDPLSIPPLSHSFSIAKMHFKNVKVYGLKKFRIDHINVDVAAMKVEAALTIHTLTVHGNYTANAFFSQSHGPFQVKLTDVYVKAISTLEVQRSGQLEAQDISMDITFQDIAMDFKGLGFLASVFEGVINSVGTFLFDAIKPFILSEVNTNLRKDVNEQVRKIPQKFPNSISPFDQLVAEVRHKIRDANFDPYRIKDYNTSVAVFDILLTNTWVTGLSSVHRVGEITFEIKNKTVYTVVEVGTQKLEGRSNWEVSLITEFMSRAGSLLFTVEYVKVQASVSQSMNTTKSPKIEDIQLELGNIQVRFDGAGTMDYMVEFAINIIPNLLRYQIMDALENPVKQKIQEVLNTVNVERIVKENREKIDKPGAIDYNLFNIK